jgi:hypothetical protein
MPKSESTSPLLLKPIDELLIGSYPFVRQTDEIYYLMEYTKRKLPTHSPENQLISNYKKKPARQASPDYRYKEPAIKEVATRFRQSILQTAGLSGRVQRALLVPIPPHAAKEDPEHDDRNLKMLNYFMPKGNIHELLLQKNSRAPLHESKELRDPKKLEENYLINPASSDAAFDEIWLFDDVLRCGTHFRAAHTILAKYFPEKQIVGFFIARSIEC